MKAGILGFILTLSLTIILGIIFTVSGRDLRRSELDESLTNAIEQTMAVVYLGKTYNINNKDELVADFTGNLLSQFGSNANVDVNILNIDFVNGCLDVQATETFKHFTGKEGKITIRKTVIFEQYKDPNDKFYQVRFLNPDGTLFKQLQVYNEGRINAPTPGPVNLIRWEQLDHTGWDGDFSKIIVTQDLTFKAVCS